MLEHIDNGEHKHDDKTVEGDESHEDHEQDSLWKALMEQLSCSTLPADDVDPSLKDLETIIGGEDVEERK